MHGRTGLCCTHPDRRITVLIGQLQHPGFEESNCCDRPHSASHARDADARGCRRCGAAHRRAPAAQRSQAQTILRIHGCRRPQSQHSRPRADCLRRADSPSLDGAPRRHHPERRCAPCAGWSFESGGAPCVRAAGARCGAARGAARAQGATGAQGARVRASASATHRRARAGRGAAARASASARGVLQWCCSVPPHS